MASRHEWDAERARLKARLKRIELEHQRRQARRAAIEAACLTLLAIGALVMFASLIERVM